MIEVYDATAGARRKERINSHGRQPGDPVRAAATLVQIVLCESPPFRLASGRAAVTRIRAELESHIEEIDTWAELSNGAIFRRPPRPVDGLASAAPATWSRILYAAQKRYRA